MEITVRLFAFQAEQAGTDAVTVSLPAQATVADAVAEMRRRFPPLVWPPGMLLAINQSYAPPPTSLHNGDELAFIPPVSGG